MKALLLCAGFALATVAVAMAAEEDDVRAVLVRIDPSVLFGRELEPLPVQVPALGPGECYDVAQALGDLVPGAAAPAVAVFNPESGWLYARGTGAQLAVVLLASGDTAGDTVAVEIPEVEVLVRLIVQDDDDGEAVELFRMTVGALPGRPGTVEWTDPASGNRNSVRVEVIPAGAKADVDVKARLWLTGGEVKVDTQYVERSGVDRVVASIRAGADGEVATTLCMVRVDFGWKEYEVPDQTRARAGRIEAIEATLAGDGPRDEEAAPQVNPFDPD